MAELFCVSSLPNDAPVSAAGMIGAKRQGGRVLIPARTFFLQSPCVFLSGSQSFPPLTLLFSVTRPVQVALAVVQRR